MFRGRKREVHGSKTSLAECIVNIKGKLKEAVEKREP